MATVIAKPSSHPAGELIACDPAVRWTLPAKWRSKLLNARGQLRLDEWLSDGSATIFKQAPHRTIYRIQNDDHDFFLKQYQAVGLRGQLRELIRPVKAKSEFDKSTLLSRRGIAVPKAIGWGVLGPGWSPIASFLISETVHDAVPLTDYLASEPTPNERQGIAQALGSFVAWLHAACAIHRDFHPANLLFRRAIRGYPEFILIDLHEVGIRQSNSWRKRRENLVTLNRWFILRSSRSDRLRFWRAYEACTRLPDHPAARPQSIETDTLHSNAAFWQSRRKRYGASSRHVKQLRSGHFCGLAINGLNEELAHDLCTNPDRLFNDEHAKLLKDGGASTVARIDFNHQSLILKRFNVKRRMDHIKNQFRKSAALRSWILGHALVDAGLPTANPFAVFHRYRHGLPAEGYLLTEALKDVTDLRTFADRLGNLAASQRRRILVPRIEAVARTIREFHARHFGHRDLKAANLLTPNATNDPRVWFIDLVGVCRRKKVRKKNSARDLARILASFLNHPVLTNTDRLRFLRHYLNWHLHGKSGWKWWWRELSELAQAKVQRNRRLGRPLT